MAIVYNPHFISLLTMALRKSAIRAILLVSSHIIILLKRLPKYRITDKTSPIALVYFHQSETTVTRH